jgi:hypothetical protein
MQVEPDPPCYRLVMLSHNEPRLSYWFSDLDISSFRLSNNSCDRHRKWSGHGAESHGEGKEGDDGALEHFDGGGMF